MAKIDLSDKISYWFIRLFTFKMIHKIETIAVGFALSGFLIHLLLIFMKNMGYLTHPIFNDFPTSYIYAIYTPFSFLLIYEVFLFLIYLPKSFTKSIGKQYEIISLIVLRRIFKHISHVDMNNLKLDTPQNMELLVDMVGVLLLFLFIAIFYHLKKKQPQADGCTDLKHFVAIKRMISMLLMPVLFGLAIYSFGHWFWDALHFSEGQTSSIPDINDVFYDTFFSILIYVDVFILIISFLYTHYYSQLIRNSGFIISTVLIRMSFTAPYITNLSLIIASVLFGVLILLIYNFFIKADDRVDELLPKENLPK